MPNNKRQHYVPKFLLRRFSSGGNNRQLDMYNADLDKIIRKVSLREQCYCDYFYGEKNEIEANLCSLEGIFATVCNDIITNSAINVRDKLNITMMIALQKNRTLRAEKDTNNMISKFAKIMLHRQIEERNLRSIDIGLQNGVSAFLGRALALSPIMLDLKQFIVVNKTKVPFIVSDNPVCFTNWFSSTRKIIGSSIGMSSSGLQITMPLSPKHALYLHDSNVYNADYQDRIISLFKDDEAMHLNVIQYLNSYRNVYFNSEFTDAYVNSLKSSKRVQHDGHNFQRLDKIAGTNNYIMTNKDEYSPVSTDTASELIHISQRSIGMSIRVPRVKIRAKPKFHHNGSIAPPVRDPAWSRIIKDFAKLVEEQKANFNDIWDFSEKHPLARQIGTWMNRAR